MDLDGKADVSYLLKQPEILGPSLFSVDPSFPNRGSESLITYPGPNYLADLDGDGLSDLVTPGYLGFVVGPGTTYWAYAHNNGAPFGRGILRPRAEIMEMEQAGRGLSRHAGTGGFDS
jgi:hypothetical protein